MANENASQYHKLCSNNVVRTANQQAIWLGADHLLVSENSYYEERYRRILYRDIECIVAVRTSRRGKLNALFIALLLLFGLIGYTLSDANWGAVFASVAYAGSPLWLAAVVNTAMGPTTMTYLRTRVLRQQLPALQRMRKLDRHMPELVARIEAAQGALTPEMLARATPPPHQPGAIAAPAPPNSAAAPRLTPTMQTAPPPMPGSGPPESAP